MDMLWTVVLGRAKLFCRPLAILNMVDVVGPFLFINEIVSLAFVVTRAGIGGLLMILTYSIVVCGPIAVITYIMDAFLYCISEVVLKISDPHLRVRRFVDWCAEKSRIPLDMGLTLLYL